MEIKYQKYLQPQLKYLLVHFREFLKANLKIDDVPPLEKNQKNYVQDANRKYVKF